MNTKKTAITIVAAMMAIAMITVAMAAICDEPCGTKVTQCTDGAPTKDAVYALVIPGVTQGVPAMAIGFVDDGDGVFEEGECLYIDTNAGIPTIAGPNQVEQGDIRLNGSCGCGPNTPALACDLDIGNQLTYLAGGTAAGQRLAGYVDADLSGYYDITDPLYLDMDLSSTVTPNDLRLTGFMGEDPYTVVVPGDPDHDIGSPIPLNDLVTQAAPVATAINDLLGFVDTSCDNMWDNRNTMPALATGEDKLYLQQPVLTGAMAAVPNRLNVLDPFEDFVTIGDFRIYMPVDEPCWPDCGTKVMQCDGDATYPILIPGVDSTNAQGAVPAMTIDWVDVNGDGVFTGGTDHVYINVDGAGIDTVSAGDVRLTEACGCEPNTVVGTCMSCPDAFCDFGDAYEPRMAQAVAGYVDVGVRDGVYDLADPLYLDISAINGIGTNAVSANDIRLTERTVGGVTYPAWSMVKSGDQDTFVPPVGLDDLIAQGGVVAIVTPINTLLGFVDSNCDGEWATDGTDKLYLQQIVYPLAAGNADVNQFDRFSTIGDFRLYMPIDEDCWPDCGTKVTECDIDETGALLRTAIGAPAPINGVPASMRVIISSSGCVYLDTNSGILEVEVGDVRLTECCDIDPNTVVKDCDDDWSVPAAPPVPAADTLLGYVDVNGNDIYDIEDALYLDLNQAGAASDGRVSPGDLRLTGRTDAGMDFDPYTIVMSGHADATTSANEMRAPKDNFVMLGGASPTQDINNYLAFRDSNCTQEWDSIDGGYELYLQQMVPEPFTMAIQEPQFNNFSTIGDFRIYMPPSSGPYEGPCDIYDANDNGYIDKDELKTAIYDYLTTPIGTVINKDDLKILIYDYLDHL